METNKQRGSTANNGGNSFANGAIWPWWARNWQFQQLLESQFSHWTEMA